MINVLQWGIYQSAEAENQMTSVERVIEYSQLDSEADLESNKGKMQFPIIKKKLFS